jgi:uncharacterized membrane-anchored protein
MRSIHLPRVEPRYWVAILLASVLGTNLGDLYAHASGLGIGRGLAVLALLGGIVFVAELVDETAREAWYWIVILIIRTGATNIGDFLAFRLRLPPLWLGPGLAVVLAALGLMTRRHAGRSPDDPAHRLPRADMVYWLAMLCAGVLGTVLGDDCSHAIGQGAASLVLGGALAAAVALFRGKITAVMQYWLVIALARTAGTTMGDLLAENRLLDLGLPTAALISAAAFIAVLVFWRSRVWRSDDLPGGQQEDHA